MADRGKHCVLDLPPHAIDKLVNDEFHPIVIHVTSDTANLKGEVLGITFYKKLYTLNEQNITFHDKMH